MLSDRIARIGCAVIIVLGFALPARAQTPVNIRQIGDVTVGSALPVVASIPGGGTLAYTGTGATVTTLSTTSGTVATANTIYLGQLSCYNTSTTTADTLSRTDTAGNQFEVTFSIPAKSNYLRSYSVPEKMVGLKWWSANGTLNCTVGATQ